MPRFKSKDITIYFILQLSILLKKRFSVNYKEPLQIFYLIVAVDLEFHLG